MAGGSSLAVRVPYDRWDLDRVYSPEAPAKVFVHMPCCSSSCTCASAQADSPYTQTKTVIYLWSPKEVRIVPWGRSSVAHHLLGLKSAQPMGTSGLSPGSMLATLDLLTSALNAVSPGRGWTIDGLQCSPVYVHLRSR